MGLPPLPPPSKADPAPAMYRQGELWPGMQRPPGRKPRRRRRRPVSRAPDTSAAYEQGELWTGGAV